MIRFSDILYGEVLLPEWLEPFFKLPEFVRLRGVRLSNVDSYEFKDFNGPMRWEHSIAVSYLAIKCAQKRGLDKRDTIHLALGGLLHDVATPPFGHTLEYILPGFDHELESQKLLSAVQGQDFLPSVPVFASQVPHFWDACKALAKSLRITVDPDEVANIVVGRGNLGFLVHGVLDLDNADNVIRACHYLGIDVDTKLPLRLAEWLGNQESRPTDLKSCDSTDVQMWRDCRDRLYSRFFNSSEGELARQAFLQHIMRRAVATGFPRRQLVWNTDERLLFELERFKGTEQASIPLRELVQRYRLLESPIKVAQIDIDDRETLSILRNPEAAAWIEQETSTLSAEIMAMVSVRRHLAGRDSSSLFLPSLGSILLFKLGTAITHKQLPSQLRKQVSSQSTGKRLLAALSSVLKEKTTHWVQEKPWLRFSPERQERVVESLEFVGDWGFRLSRNDNVHPYPGTFVYTIPASLITALDLKGELILDPFGGTGQTAIEAVKYGGRAVSADSCSIACLAAEAKTTFLPVEDRDWLREIGPDCLGKYKPCVAPEFENINKWFHAKTLDQLCRVWRFIGAQRRPERKQFLKSCFSAMLPSCTGRRGKQHGWFADNTPLETGVVSPPYQDALGEFVARIQEGVVSLEDLYAFMERNGRDPEVELAKVRVVQSDAKTAGPKEYGLKPHSVAGIITSPPYLCMLDYTLGQRLSYQWMYPDALKKDFATELGARRLRLRKGDHLADYLTGLQGFAKQAAALLRRSGFLATVLGAPVAKAFASANIIPKYDSIMEDAGFKLLWEHDRTIHWHRNYGYSKLKSERISVHVLT